MDAPKELLLTVLRLADVQNAHYNGDTGQIY
jgi:hypothetical protein